MTLISLLSKPRRAATVRRLLPALLPLLAGCETAIDVPEPAHTPRVALVLTLDNLPAADSLRRESFLGRQPFVSLSQRLYDLTPLRGRDDATLEVRDAAGTVVEHYRPAGTRTPGGPFFFPGQYRPARHYRFQPGQTYAVRATVPGAEAAESRLTLPTTVPVQLTVAPLSSTPGQQRLRVTVAFDDPAAAGDYYLATARVTDDAGRQRSSLDLTDNNSGVDVPTYQLSYPNSSYELYPFSDANANGQRISFSQNVVYYDSGQPGGPLYLEVTLSHLTRELYLFYNSYVQYSNNNGNPFAEPTPLYSNVSGGYGIFGGATDATMRVPL